MVNSSPFESSAPVDLYVNSRKAASVIVVRDRSPGEIEILMMRRAERAGDFRSGAVVFPGGVLDARDREAHAHCMGWDDVAASQRLGLDQGGLDYWIAAARECFEEVGLLFLDPLSPQAASQAHASWRAAMQAGEAGIAELCQALGSRIDLRQWAYFAHWLTPLGRNKRFDTRFFVTVAPPGQEAVADRAEAVELMWVTPAEALDRAAEYKLLPVTRRNLQDLAQFDSAQSVLDHARSLRDIPLVLPRLASSSKGERIVHPSEFSWAEIGRLDPHGHGQAWCEITAGRVVRLSPRVMRITAPNPGMMTGPGTNTYLVGDPSRSRWTVIDPGPADAQHIQTLMDAAQGAIERICVTHTHVDHSPGAVALAQATGAPVWGRRPAHAQGQDPTFNPQCELEGGERIELGPTTHLQVVHTPGHASNHLCYLLEEEKTLFCGDHVMQGSTVVINPPDGDMRVYLHSLQELLNVELDWLAPGHGFLVAQPHAVVRALIAHRLGRESKVVAGMQELGPASIEGLVSVVYADVPVGLHPVARRSLLAHLLKLQADGRARVDEDIWSLAT